jgi:hypothetical protein
LDNIPLNQQGSKTKIILWIFARNVTLHRSENECFIKIW